MKSKSFNIDIMMSWEYGLIIVVLGIIFLVLGVRQSKKVFDDLDKLPFTKPTTKTLFGSVAIIFGSIQLIPLFSEN